MLKGRLGLEHARLPHADWYRLPQSRRVLRQVNMFRLLSPRGSPARAGMALTAPTSSAHFSGFPPPARGWPLRASHLSELYPSSPACAGMAPLRRRPRGLGSGFPRPRGGGPYQNYFWDYWAKVPPPARGWSWLPSLRDARDRPGRFCLTTISRGVRQRIWGVLSALWEGVPGGSVVMVWKDDTAPGALGLLALGIPRRTLANLDGVLFWSAGAE
nr:hypothetical protein Hi04_10k_c4997_00002 [uncultured bacterium]